LQADIKRRVTAPHREMERKIFTLTMSPFLLAPRGQLDLVHGCKGPANLHKRDIVQPGDNWRTRLASGLGNGSLKVGQTLDK